VLAKVLGAIERHRMAQRGQRWGVAVSGGPDSVALLEALVELADRIGIRLGVAHFNHRLRGAESDADEAFVRQRAADLGLPFERDEAVPCETDGENLEAAARRARYAFFDRLLEQGTFERIATGHTLSDQAETVLFRVLRGTGVTGLAAVRPVREPGIVRPLIDVSRREVIEWLEQRGSSWREDSSNRDPRFSRNRLRRDLLPRLREEWNPQVDEALARLGAQAAAEESYWDDVVAQALESLAAAQGSGSVEIDCLAARALHPAVLHRCLERLARQSKAPGRQFDAQALEQLAAMIRPDGPKQAHLPGLTARRSCDILLLRRESPAEPGAPIEANAPGDFTAPDGRSQVQLRFTAGAETLDGRNLLDYNRLTSLHLRAWQPGDRLAGEAQRPMRELFRTSGVPAWERERWPVLAGFSGLEPVVVWSRGFGASQAFAASAATPVAVEVKEIAGDGREIRRIEDWTGGRWSRRIMTGSMTGGL
jgi:tRNA(Ile)-lysidine synthase